MYYNCCITACSFFLLVFFKNSSLKSDEIASMSTRKWQAILGEKLDKPEDLEKSIKTGRKLAVPGGLADCVCWLINPNWQKNKKKCWKFGSKNLGSYNDCNVLMSLKYFCFLMLRNLCLLWKKNLGFIFP